MSAKAFERFWGVGSVGEVSKTPFGVEERRDFDECGEVVGAAGEESYCVIAFAGLAGSTLTPLFVH